MYRLLMRGFGISLLLSSQVPSLAAAESRPIGILLAAGDITNCSSSRSAYEAVADAVGREITEAGETPIKILALGDIAYKTGRISYAECLKEFDRTWGTYKQYILPVPGNHDYSDDPSGNALTFFSYFSEFYASVDKKAPNGSYVAPFPAGHGSAWILVAYNFYADRAKEIEFLIQNLPDDPNDCLIGFTHPFFNSSGNHGSKLENLTYDRMRPFFRLLHEFGAVAMVAAHDHHFEQFKPMGLRGDEESNGVRQFVVGTGGAPLYTREANPKHPSSEFFDRMTHGILKIELYTDSYAWSFVPIEGQEPFELVSHEGSCRSR